MVLIFVVSIKSDTALHNHVIIDSEMLDVVFEHPNVGGREISLM